MKIIINVAAHFLRKESGDSVRYFCVAVYKK